MTKISCLVLLDLSEYVTRWSRIVRKIQSFIIYWSNLEIISMAHSAVNLQYSIDSTYSTMWNTVSFRIFRKKRTAKESIKSNRLFKTTQHFIANLALAYLVNEFRKKRSVVVTRTWWLSGPPCTLAKGPNTISKNITHEKLSYCWETVRRESMPKIAEIDVEMTT